MKGASIGVPFFSAFALASFNDNAIPAKLLIF
jgi:hypothetical protein